MFQRFIKVLIFVLINCLLKYDSQLLYADTCQRSQQLCCMAHGKLFYLGKSKKKLRTKVTKIVIWSFQKLCFPVLAEIVVDYADMMSLQRWWVGGESKQGKRPAALNFVLANGSQGGMGGKVTVVFLQKQ